VSRSARAGDAKRIRRPPVRSGGRNRSRWLPKADDLPSNLDIQPKREGHVDGLDEYQVARIGTLGVKQFQQRVLALLFRMRRGGVIW